VEAQPKCKNNNGDLERIVEALKGVATNPSKQIQVDKPFKLSSFLPETLDFFSYDGSLTTPSCAEAVKWSVVREPLCISNESLEAFRRVIDMHGEELHSNHRPTQAIADRVVSFYRVEKKDQALSAASIVKVFKWEGLTPILVINLLSMSNFL
jgi:carbonic anhydrase